MRTIFDGKTFVPEQPVSLPAQSVALLLGDQNDPTAQHQLDAAVRAYYQPRPAPTPTTAPGPTPPRRNRTAPATRTDR